MISNLTNFRLAQNGKRVLIIAEAGVNHNGDVKTAMRLIDAAVAAGADYVKFQTFKTEDEISRSAPAAEYQERNAEANSQFEMVKKLEIDEATHLELIEYCEKKAIGFLSSPFDHGSIDLLDKLALPLIKVPSGEVNNLPYLRHIAGKQKPLILSTGMCEMHEVESALKILNLHGLKSEDIIVLQCNTEYPTPFEDANLLAMNSIKQVCGVSVGYSDHTLGVEAAIAAVALGACCIEKHFTLNRSDVGPDHAASIEPGELQYMIQCVRNVEKALGSTIKKPSPSEVKNLAIARKSVHLNVDLTAGTVLCEDHLIMKRPGNGISPMDYEQLIGKRLNHSMNEDEMLLWSDLD